MTKIKRWLPVVIMMSILILFMALSGGTNGIAWFFDVPSLLFLVVINVPMLIAADSVGDFANAFKYASGNNDFTLKELRSSRNAVSLSIKLNYVGGIFGSLMGIIGMSGNLGDEFNDHIGPALAMAVLTIMYGLLINILLYAVRTRIEKEIIYRTP